MDKLKSEDRDKLLSALQDKYKNDPPEGYLRFKEIEEFKAGLKSIVTDYEKKLPKTTKRVVVVSDDEE